MFDSQTSNFASSKPVIFLPIFAYKSKRKYFTWPVRHIIILQTAIEIKRFLYYTCLKRFKCCSIQLILNLSNKECVFLQLTSCVQSKKRIHETDRERVMSFNSQTCPVYLFRLLEF